MVAGVNHRHFGGHSLTRWALAALSHVFVAVVTVVHDSCFHFGHVHLAHAAFAGLHGGHVTVSAGINGLGLAHFHFSLG